MKPQILIDMISLTVAPGGLGYDLRDKFAMHMNPLPTHSVSEGLDISTCGPTLVK